jgi:hypothetical protein
VGRLCNVCISLAIPKTETIPLEDNVFWRFNLLKSTIFLPDFNQVGFLNGSHKRPGYKIS